MGSLTRLSLVGVVLLSTACASGNRPLQLLDGAGPVYPATARANGVEGFVTVRYDVDIAGAVLNARVVESEPAGVFDAAALAAVQSWRFNPPREDGRAVPARDRHSTVTFRLGEGSEYDKYVR